MRACSVGCIGGIVELLQGGGSLAHVRVAAAKEVVGEYTGSLPLIPPKGGGLMVVVVADAAHQGGVAGGEDGVALVFGVGAQEVVAHEIAPRHLCGVLGNAVEERQGRVGAGVDEGVNPTQPPRKPPSYPPEGGKIVAGRQGYEGDGNSRDVAADAVCRGDMSSSVVAHGFDVEKVVDIAFRRQRYKFTANYAIFSSFFIQIKKRSDCVAALLGRMYQG